MIDEKVQKYCDSLLQAQNDLANNLVSKGVEASTDETLNELAGKVLNIPSGSDDSLVLSLIDRTITEITSDDLTTIGNYAFAHCSNLESINVDNVESLGTYAFLNCQSLTGEYRFEKLTSIGGGAFCGAGSWTNGCAIETLEFDVLETLTANSISMSPQTSANSKIKNIYFGNLKNIPSGNTFYYALINSIVIATNQLCSLGSTNIFVNSNIAKGKGYIYVPQSLLEEYKVATNWSTYANQFRAIEDYVDYLKTIYTKIDFSSWEVAA
jgi:hypothetical protein